VRIVGGKNGWVMPDEGEVATIWLYPSTSGKVTLRIYTLRGILVWEKEVWVDGGIEKEVVWECTNNSFKKVASGIYILYVKGAGIKKKCKLAIIR
jgi:pentose-5-phosphate-3-epimerase